jgi:hypothetical protein
MTRPRRRIALWLAMVAFWPTVVGSPGCSEELGPEHRVVARVKGVVREGGKPVTSGWIEFFPVDGTVGDLCSARIGADGSFEALYVPVGVNLIRLVNVPVTSPAAKQVFGAYKSPIRRTIAAVPPGPIVVDVVDEAIRFRNEQSASTRPPAPGPGASR